MSAILRDAVDDTAQASELGAALATVCALWAPDAALALAWWSVETEEGACQYRASPEQEAAVLDLLEGRQLNAAWPLAAQWQLSPGVRVALVGSASTPLDSAARARLMEVAQPLLGALITALVQRQRITELESSKRLLSALYEIADLAGGDHELSELLAHFHRIVGSLIYAENCYIVEYDDAQQSLRFLYFADTSHEFHPDPEREYVSSDLPNSLTFPLLQHGQPVSGPSRVLFQRFGLQREGHVAFGPDASDWMGIPMKRGTRVCGAIVVQSYEPGVRYGDQERALLDFVAKHILTAMDRHAAHAQLERRVEARTQQLRQLNHSLEAEVGERRRAERLQSALFSISELAIACRTQDQFYEEVHAVVGTLLDARNFYIATLNEAGDTLELVYSSDPHLPPRSSRPVGNGLTERVLSQREPLLLDAPTIDRMLGSGEFSQYGVKCHCWLGVPLFSDNDVVGAVVVQSYSQEISFTAVDQRLLGFVSHNIGVGLSRQRDQNNLRLAHAQLEARVEERTAELATVNAELLTQIDGRQRIEQRLRHLAMYDVLTGLPNRLQLLEALQGCIDQARAGDAPPFALLFLDLDRFKLVNDSMGHAAGDQLLVEVAKRLVGGLSADNVVARLGGDEFALLVRRCGDAAQLCEMARHLLGVIGQPLRIGGRELFPAGSIGIAVWNEQYASGEEMLRDADAAMYRAKASRQDRYLMFDAAMNEAAFNSLELEADLRRAIINREFVPYYQPVVSLVDQSLVGHEALMRWKHPTRGLLSPGAFLGVAEESGLIEQIDWLMYEAVIAALSRGGEGYISVNVSPRHIRSPHFLPRIIGLVARSGADPRRLRMEITEMVLLDDDSRTLGTIRVLAEHGIQVQLDDFGTGYSALSYLHKFPIATLKIDRSFIAGLHDDNGNGTLTLVQGILSLAKTLGIDTIAEGIETPEQLETLRALRCTMGQGYLLGAPSPMAPHQRR